MIRLTYYPHFLMVTFQGKSLRWKFQNMMTYDDIIWLIWMKIYEVGSRNWMKLKYSHSPKQYVNLHHEQICASCANRGHTISVIVITTSPRESDAFVEHLYTAQPEGRKQSIDSISIRLVTSMHSVWKKTIGDLCGFSICSFVLLSSQ